MLKKRWPGWMERGRHPPPPPPPIGICQFCEKLKWWILIYFSETIVHYEEVFFLFNCCFCLRVPSMVFCSFPAFLSSFYLFIYLLFFFQPSDVFRIINFEFICILIAVSHYLSAPRNAAVLMNFSPPPPGWGGGGEKNKPPKKHNKQVAWLVFKKKMFYFILFSLFS